MAFWKLLDHSHVQSSFSAITKHIDNSILKDTLQLNILRTWINIRVKSLIKTLVNITKQKLMKNISCTIIRSCTLKNIVPKYTTCYLFYTLLFLSNLVFKFNLVLISILDNFRHNLFDFLPFNPLMHNAPKWSDILAAFTARFLKCVWPFWDFMH